MNENIYEILSKICWNCDNFSFCENYAQGDCLALKILEKLIQDGKLKIEDIEGIKEGEK